MTGFVVLRACYVGTVLWCSPRMNSPSAPEVVLRETPRIGGGARSDREPGGGERGEAESRHFCQGRHFCTGKRDRIEGIQFLTVGTDMDKIVGV